MLSFCDGLGKPLAPYSALFSLGLATNVTHIQEKSVHFRCHCFCLYRSDFILINTPSPLCRGLESCPAPVLQPHGDLLLASFDFRSLQLACFSTTTTHLLTPVSLTSHLFLSLCFPEILPYLCGLVPIKHVSPYAWV